ncbi:hypothetical protein [Streptomyces sp. NPDC002851]
MATGDAADGSAGAARSVRIGDVQGSAVTVGNNNVVVNRSGGAPRDPAHEELLRAVRELRTDLARMVENPQVTALDAELADAEGEIERDGRAGQGRLVRLRQALADAGGVAALFASAGTVAQAVAALTTGA